MKLFSFLLTVSCVAPLAHAQTPGTPLNAPARVTRESQSSRAGLTSPVTSQRLNAALPKFIARTPEASPAIATEEPLDSEGPRNAIIRLPQFDVQDDKVPEFRQREVLTQKGRVDVALRRHPGLKFGPLSFLNVRRGLEMLAEEDEVERRREMTELMSFQAAIDRSLPQNPATGFRTIRVNATR